MGGEGKLLQQLLLKWGLSGKVAESWREEVDGSRCPPSLVVWFGEGKRKEMREGTSQLVSVMPATTSETGFFSHCQTPHFSRLA